MGLADLLAGPEALPCVEEVQPDDVAALLFTGGITGLSKGVEHTHARLIQAVWCSNWVCPTRTQGDVCLPIAPFTHIYSFLQGVLGPVFARAETVLLERFRPEEVVELMARHRGTVFGGGPPAIHAGLLAAPNLAASDFSSLRVCPAGGVLPRGADGALALRDWLRDPRGLRHDGDGAGFRSRSWTWKPARASCPRASGVRCACAGLT